MTTDENFETVSYLATETARKFSRDRIIEIVWMPLVLLYEELVKRKEIPALGTLDEKTKRSYWKEVSEKLPGRSNVRKIWAACAVYTYDLIKNENE